MIKILIVAGDQKKNKKKKQAVVLIYNCVCIQTWLWSKEGNRVSLLLSPLSLILCALGREARRRQTACAHTPAILGAMNRCPWVCTPTRAATHLLHWQPGGCANFKRAGCITTVAEPFVNNSLWPYSSSQSMMLSWQQRHVWYACRAEGHTPCFLLSTLHAMIGTKMLAMGTIFGGWGGQLAGALAPKNLCVHVCW